SKSSPSSRMQLTPPPPPRSAGRCHASRAKVPPSSDSSLATIVFWRVTRNCSTALRSMRGSSGLLAVGRGLGGSDLCARFERAVTDVAPILHAVEADAAHHFVGALLRGAHVVAERGHAQHA